MTEANLAPETEPQVSIADVLASRAAFYQTLASLYFMPLKQADIDAMAEADFSVYAELNEDFKAGVNDITRYLRKRNTGSRSELAVDFTSAFAGTQTWEGHSAVPYKSVFTSKEGLLYQEGYVEVFKAYKHECVKRREGLDWPDDHLSFMCEFMALLSQRTASALEAGDKPAAIHELEVSRDFLEQNILSWFDDFSELALKIIKTRFYRGVLSITKGFLALDAETIADLIAEVSAMDEAAPQAEGALEAPEAATAAEGAEPAAK